MPFVDDRSATSSSSSSSMSSSSSSCLRLLRPPPEAVRRAGYRGRPSSPGRKPEPSPIRRAIRSASVSPCVFLDLGTGISTVLRKNLNARSALRASFCFYPFVLGLSEISINEASRLRHSGRPPSTTMSSTASIIPIDDAPEPLGRPAYHSSPRTLHGYFSPLMTALYVSLL